MELENGLDFNCAESLLIKVKRDMPIPNFNPCCMRIASLLGGGISGTGEICGALSGALICLGLTGGTEGTEDRDEFQRKRTRTRVINQEFIASFVEEWGSTRCAELIAMDREQIPKMGKLRNNNGPAISHCDDYVQWAADWALAYLRHQQSD